MARVRLTKNAIAGLTMARDGDWVTDTEVPQLLVRLTPTAKTFVARWTSKVTGKRLTTSIAPCGSISVDEARDRARKLVTADEAPTVTTLGDVYRIWLEKYSDDRTAHVKDFQSAWKNHIEPHFGKTKLSRLTSAELQRWYDTKSKEYPVVGKSGKKRDTPYAASVINRWVAYISRLCAIARKNGFMVGNPCEDLEKSTPNRRVTIFVRDDIKDFADNLLTVEHKHPIAVGLLRFLMIYPCRGIEARQMRWDDLEFSSDGKSGKFSVPAHRYKTRVAKEFPLGPMQTAHLRSLPRWSETFVFPSPMNRDAPMRYEHQRDIWEKTRPKPLGAHALRKTVGTSMLNGGMPLEIVSKLMGHSSTLVTQQVYAHLSTETAAKHLSLWSSLTEEDEAEPTEEERADATVLESQAARMIARETQN